MDKLERHHNCLACRLLDPTPEEAKRDQEELQKWWDDKIMEQLKILCPEYIKS